MNSILVWIKAFRLRTLPLALSSAILGSFLALASGQFSWLVFILASLTTLFLQILSNLANDYGDFVHGVDNENRVGPVRITQHGLVSPGSMKAMIIVFVILALVSGSTLILIGLNGVPIKNIIILFLLGFSAIFAAINYTVGKKPYGYVGLGDLFVFIYFGIVGVAGTFYLHTHYFNPWVLLPASAIGLLSSGVLNLNNMRDIENDTRSGKRTLVVCIGSKAAKYYHTSLITLSFIFSVMYALKFFTSIYQYLFILTTPLFFMNVMVVLQNTEPANLNNELKKLAISTFAFSVAFGIGLIIQ
jgi:1,4-dihydroxy-2-naphthoate polyprenyltransferase